MPIDKLTGYRKPDYSELLEDVQQLFINKFGEDIDLTDISVAGGLSNIAADLSDKFEQIGQSIYNSRFLMKSSGNQLDDIGADENVYRKPATNSYVELTIQALVDTDSPVIISADDGEFSTADGHIFQIIDDITISEQGKDSSNNPLEDEDGNPLGEATIEAASIETGADNNVMANTIINAEQAIDGFYSVTNKEAATGGQNTESDESLKRRISSQRNFQFNANEGGIENAIKNISNVSDARLVNNRSMQTDEFGNPAKSIHLYVVGGNDTDIANTMVKYMPPLAQTVGSIQAIGKDIANKSYSINFDRAKTVQVYFKINIKTDENSFNNDDGFNDIKNNIINYFSDLKMGNNVDFTKLFSPIYSVAGVIGVDLNLGTTKDDLKANQDISVNTFELPVVNADSIEIEVVD